MEDGERKWVFAEGLCQVGAKWEGVYPINKKKRGKSGAKQVLTPPSVLERKGKQRVRDELPNHLPSTSPREGTFDLQGGGVLWEIVKPRRGRDASLRLQLPERKANKDNCNVGA